MAGPGLPGLPPPGFASSGGGTVTAVPVAWENQGATRGLPGLPPPGFAGQSEPTAEQLLGANASPTQAAARVAVGGATRFLPFGDEIVAGGSAVVDRVLGRTNDLSQGYDRRLQEVRDYQDAFKKKSGLAAGVVDIAGALALPFQSGIAAKATLGGKVLQGAKEGAALSGLYGFAGAQDGLEKRSIEGVKQGLIGAALGGAVPVVGAGLQKFGRSADKAARGLDRASVGARSTDYVKSADELKTVELPDGDISSFTKVALDDILGGGTLGKSRDGSALLKNLREKANSIQDEVGEVIRANDGPIPVEFPRTVELLKKGGVAGESIETFTNKLGKLKENIQTAGENKLSYVQQQKISYGRKWDPIDKDVNAFNRAVYADLQKTIEKHAPEVVPLNKELSKYKAVEKIFERKLGADEAGNLVKSSMQTWRTSGGFGVPMLLGAGAAGAPGAIAAGLTGAALMSPRGLAATSSATSGLAQALKKGGSSTSGAGIIKAIAPVLGANETRRSAKLELPEVAPPLKAKESSPSPQSTAAPNRKSSTFERILDSIEKVESNGNPRAVSPKGAMGAMQLMPEIVRKFGVKDPFNRDESRRAGGQLLQEELGRFKNLRLAIAAYNAGSPKVSAAIKKAGSEDYDKIAKHLPSETRAYVEKVLEQALS